MPRPRRPLSVVPSVAAPSSTTIRHELAQLCTKIDAYGHTLTQLGQDVRRLADVAERRTLASDLLQVQSVELLRQLLERWHALPGLLRHAAAAGLLTPGEQAEG